MLKLNKSDQFCNRIIEYVQEHETGYIEASLAICDEFEVDPSSVKTMISQPIKEKIEIEAVELNFLKQSGVLPI